MMSISYGVDSYRAHDLNIAIKTSSGDVIKLDFSNEQSSSLRYSQNDESSRTSASFSSKQSFQFSIKSNGIDAQDQKEIDAFIKIAQPYIDNFLAELSQDAPNSPVTKVANEIARIFEPSRDRSEDEKNTIKTNIVKLFDNAIQDIQASEQTSVEDVVKKIFEDAQKLLEKTLKAFEDFNKNIYA